MTWAPEGVRDGLPAGGGGGVTGFVWATSTSAFFFAGATGLGGRLLGGWRFRRRGVEDLART